MKKEHLPETASIIGSCRPGQAHRWLWVSETAAEECYHCDQCDQEKAIPRSSEWRWSERPYVHPRPMHVEGGEVAGFREYLTGLLNGQREHR